MTRWPLKPERYAHGDRNRYQAGCRCLPCRAANAGYEQRRRRARANGAWNGFVIAEAAREHLEHLQALGVGRRQVARLSHLSPWLIHRIRTGRQEQLRVATAVAILSVKPELALGQRVPGYKTRRLLRSLLKEGFTKAAIAERLGLQSPNLRLDHDTVTVENYLKVLRLYRIVTEEGEST